MALNRDDKNKLIEKLRDDFENSKAIVFVEFRGMGMKDTQSLRQLLKREGIDYKVAKTTLMKIALEKTKLDVPEEIMDQPLAMAVSRGDEVMPAKLLAKVAKDVESLKILGGVINGEYSDGTIMKKLASLPSREELYARVVGGVASPLNGLVYVLQGNISGLVSVLKQYQIKIS